jgi:hypothetical protein
MLLNELNKGEELKRLVSEFIEQHKITCGETIFQSDPVIEDSLELIYSLCEVVGYCEADEDE